MMRLGRRPLLLGASAALLSGVAAPRSASAALAPYGRRQASLQLRSIHSGHSLTDAYVHTGGWPGHLRAIAGRIGVPDPQTQIVKSTIPGAPLHWRWRHRVEDLRPSHPTADARRDIAGFDTLVLAEGGPPPRLGVDGDLPLLTESLDHLCRFAGHAIEAGNGGAGLHDIAIWSIWPALTLWRPAPPDFTRSWQDMADFRAALPEYGRSHRYLADHAGHILRKAYPQLPRDWRIWIFPGHLWMQRIWDDIAAEKLPDLASIESLFSDEIHPNELCGFGLACLMTTCLYHTDLRGRSLPMMAGMTTAQRDYFTALAWEVATGYAPAGLGGTEAQADEWQSGRDTDLLPDWSPAAAREDIQ